MREALADLRVMDEAVGLGRGDDRPELVGKVHLLAEGRHSTLEGERRHGDLPALTRAAYQVRGIGAGVREEGVVEVCAAGHLAYRPDRDAGLVHRDQQVRE